MTDTTAGEGVQAMARTLYKADEEHGPIRMNLNFQQLRWHDRLRYEQMARTVIAAGGLAAQPSASPTDTTAGEGVLSLPSRDGDVTSIAQVAQCIIMNVEERDGWADDGGLVTIRCHAEVIRDDALALAAQPSAGAQGEVVAWEDRFAECHENGAHPNCRRCYRGEVPNMSCDDGSWFEMGAVSGGANEHGMFGWIEMIEHTKDGEQVRHEYVRTDSPLYTTPAQPSAGAQGEAVAWRFKQSGATRWSHIGVGEGDGTIKAMQDRPNLWNVEPLGVIATPAQPDSGDVAALRKPRTGIDLDLQDFARLLANTVEEATRNGQPLSANAKKNVRRWMREVQSLAALSKPNAPGTSK